MNAYGFSNVEELIIELRSSYFSTVSKQGIRTIFEKII